MRLLVHEKMYERNRAALEALADKLDLITMDAEGRMRAGSGEIPVDEVLPEIVYVNTDVFLSPAARSFMLAMMTSQSLAWVQSGSAGVDNPIFGQIMEKGARLTTCHGQAVSIADYVLWGVLDVVQNGAVRRAAHANREWHRQPAREVEGTNWLIVGFGAIGQATGRRARAFGAHVTGVRRNAAPDSNADAISAPGDLPNLLPLADVVVLAVPATSETRHLADKAFFDAMKPGSILVNVGRGSLVDEGALLSALEKGIPEHAVLDVFETEPLMPESPFWTHPRVTVTAHCSGLGRGNDARNDALFLDNLSRYLTGQPLLNEVNPAALG